MIGPISTACLLSSCGPGLRFWVDEPTKRVVRRPVGDDRALAACSTSLVRKASAGSPAGRRGDHLPLPVRDRLARRAQRFRSEEHTSELQSRGHLVCRLLLEKKKIHNDYNKCLDQLRYVVL